MWETLAWQPGGMIQIITQLQESYNHSRRRPYYYRELNADKVMGLQPTLGKTSHTAIIAHQKYQQFLALRILAEGEARLL